MCSVHALDVVYRMADDLVKAPQDGDGHEFFCYKKDDGKEEGGFRF